jgi:hypothetical protein
MFTPSPLPDRTRRILMLATAPFVVGAMMGCIHSLVAALLLLTLQFIPSLLRLRATAS